MTENLLDFQMIENLLDFQMIENLLDFQMTENPTDFLMSNPTNIGNFLKKEKNLFLLPNLNK
jgi:hypothetical protein